MALRRSQGRLSNAQSNSKKTKLKGIGIYLAIPTVLGIVSGVWLGSRLFEDSKKTDEAIQGQNAALSREIEALSENVTSRMRTLRTRAIEQKSKKKLADSFELWVEFQVSSDEVGQVKSILKNDSKTLKNAENDLIWAAAKQVSVEKLKTVDALYLKPEGVASMRTGLVGFAFYSEDGKSRSVIAAWMKPLTAFPELQGTFTSEEAATGRSLSLLNDDGRVVAHTNPAIVGIDLSKSQFFQKYGRKAFKSEPQTVNVIDSEPQDENSNLTQKVGYRALRSLPFLLVVEVPALQRPEGFMGLDIDLGGLNRIAATVVAVLLFGAFAAWSLERKIRRSRSALGDASDAASIFKHAEEALPSLDLTKPAAPAAIPPPFPFHAREEPSLESPAPPASVSQAIDAVSESRKAQSALKAETQKAAQGMISAEALNVAKEADRIRKNADEIRENNERIQRKIDASFDRVKIPGSEKTQGEIESATLRFDTPQAGRRLVADFEARLPSLTDPRALTQAMAETAAVLSDSPSLFFIYHSGVRAALLQSACGFPKGQAPKGFSFPIPSEALEAVLTTAAQGKIASLSTFEPLAKLILARLNIAHFEAWAITNSEERKLLGILVILQAGLQSSMHRQSIARMMKSVGDTLNDAPSL